LSPIQSQSLATTVIFEQQNEEDSNLPEATVSPPHSAQLLGFAERSNSQTGLLGMAAAKNRGRRVSFGAIRAIPQNFNERKEFHFEIGGC
jgi:hypothetical protein